MLNISIVLYHPRWQEEVLPLLAELTQVQHLRRIYLVDNSEERASEEVLDLPLMEDKRVRYLYVGENIGYGRAHNIALRESVYYHTPFHLVINSDIRVSASDIDRLLAFMHVSPEVGQVMPRIVYPDGRVQHLCKLLPTPWDVFARRFLPAWMTRRRRARYELHASGYNRMLNVPYLSGCFMLLRTEAALQARLFDERYFMYPEDIDLTRTIHRHWLTIYNPSVTVIHDHAQSSYHSMRMLWVHIVNMCRYFNKWGWFFDKERRSFNRQTLSQL